METVFTPIASLSGGALPALGTFDAPVALFVIALIGGLLMARTAMRLTVRLSPSPS